MSELLHAFTSFLQSILPPDFPLVLLLFLLLLICLIETVVIAFFFYHYSVSKKKSSLAEKQLQRVLEQKNKQEIQTAQLTTLLNAERKHNSEKIRLLEETKEELSLQFTNIAQRIFDEKTAKFDEISGERIGAILQPLNHQLHEFKKEINQIYHNDSRERVSLKHEILQLRELNQQVNQEAINLTKALKSDTKIQGNWGELVLERVLEQSGLRPGHEYETQGGFRDNENRLMKPDVILHLPGGKDIIIDSKVSLIHWEKYVNTEEESEKELHLNELVKAIRNHISGLSQKNYPELKGVHSLDFILMFMPIEAAFSTTCQRDEKLIGDALAKNIIIVTPTTLLATLRTVENIWHYEHQSKNGLEIARRAGIMYDKFRSFVEELEKMGKQLTTCHATYDNVMAKLTRNRGNLVASAEQLKDLGVQAKKELPKSITDISDLDWKN